MFPSSENELKNYGDTELIKICELFKFSKERTLEQWKLLRSNIYNIAANCAESKLGRFCLSQN